MDIDHAVMWTLENLAQVPGVKAPEAVVIEQFSVSDSTQNSRNTFLAVLPESTENFLNNKKADVGRP